MSFFTSPGPAPALAGLREGSGRTSPGAGRAGRGMDLTDCRSTLYEASFTHLRRGDGTTVDLTEAYIKEHTY